MPIAVRTKTPARLLVLTVVGLAMVGLSACDSSSGPLATTGPDAHLRQVTVVGSGKVQGTPDTVTVDAAIETIAPDATSALNQSNDRMTAVLDAVKSQGIDPKDIGTTGVTLLATAKWASRALLSAVEVGVSPPSPTGPYPARSCASALVCINEGLQISSMRWWPSGCLTAVTVLSKHRGDRFVPGLRQGHPTWAA
jgi:hypothetical protein